MGSGRGCFLGCFERVVTLIVVAVFGVVFIIGLKRVLWVPEWQSQPVDPIAVQRFQQRIAAMVLRNETPARLTVSEQEVNAFLTLKTSDRVRVVFKDGLVELETIVRPCDPPGSGLFGWIERLFQGMELYVIYRGVPRIAEEKFYLDPIDGVIGKQRFPAWFVEGAFSLFGRDSLSLPLPPQVRDVKVMPAALILVVQEG